MIQGQLQLSLHDFTSSEISVLSSYLFFWLVYFRSTSLFEIWKLQALRNKPETEGGAPQNRRQGPHIEACVEEDALNFPCVYVPAEWIASNKYVIQCSLNATILFQLMMNKNKWFFCKIDSLCNRPKNLSLNTKQNTHNQNIFTLFKLIK